MAASAGKLFSRHAKHKHWMQNRSAITEAPPMRWFLTSLSLLFMALFVVLPLVVIFSQAFSKGMGAYFAALSDPDTQSAIRLTLLVGLLPCR